jgi:hypothetical protein
MREKLLQGVTCDEDGVLHIAVRFGETSASFHLWQTSCRTALFRPRKWCTGKRGRRERCVRIKIDGEVVAERQLHVEFLRVTNHKGETCLNEAVSEAMHIF